MRTPTRNTPAFVSLHFAAVVCIAQEVIPPFALYYPTFSFSASSMESAKDKKRVAAGEVKGFAKELGVLLPDPLIHKRDWSLADFQTAFGAAEGGCTTDDHTSRMSALRAKFHGDEAQGAPVVADATQLELCSTQP